MMLSGLELAFLEPYSPDFTWLQPRSRHVERQIAATGFHPVCRAGCPRDGRNGCFSHGVGA